MLQICAVFKVLAVVQKNEHKVSLKRFLHLILTWLKMSLMILTEGKTPISWILISAPWTGNPFIPLLLQASLRTFPLFTLRLAFERQRTKEDKGFHVFP